MNGTVVFASHLKPAAFSGWLESLMDRFRHADRAVPFRPARFLSQIETQAELNLGASHIFYQQLCEREPDWRTLIERLDQCHERGEEMHWAIAQSLRHTYITPLDSEDLLGLSLRLVRLIGGVGQSARLVAGSGLPHGPFAEPQKHLSACCESLAEITVALENQQPSHQPLIELWRRHRVARRALRERSTSLLQTPGDPVTVARSLAIHRSMSAQASQIRRLNLFVRAVTLKNG